MIKKRIKITPTSALILEGGGMRGTFTSGVLDNFMERGIRFPYTIGVSAGACNGLSYMSRQRGRAKYCNIDLLEKHRYISLKNFLLKGNIMDFDLLFRAIPEEIYPFDYETYTRCDEKFEMVTTSCLTGAPCYFQEKNNPARIIEIVRASSSLPFVSPIASVDGAPMMDGGVSDSIPLHRAIELGYDNNVVILTRNKGYRKPTKKTMVPFFMYRKYPQLVKALRSHHVRYNRTVRRIAALEREGSIFVIRPKESLNIGRLEKDAQSIQRVYDIGRADGEKYITALSKWISKE
jgi:predicted patatin/cPLA2 family phospholipase